jgi:hypothetical protein
MTSESGKEGGRGKKKSLPRNQGNLSGIRSE